MNWCIISLFVGVNSVFLTPDFTYIIEGIENGQTSTFEKIGGGCYQYFVDSYTADPISKISFEWRKAWKNISIPPNNDICHLSVYNNKNITLVHNTSGTHCYLEPPVEVCFPFRKTGIPMIHKLSTNVISNTSSKSPRIFSNMSVYQENENCGVMNIDIGSQKEGVKFSAGIYLMTELESVKLPKSTDECSYISAFGGIGGTGTSKCFPIEVKFCWKKDSKESDSSGLGKGWIILITCFIVLSIGLFCACVYRLMHVRERKTFEGYTIIQT